MKNIIYGVGAWQEGFQYVFDDIKTEYYIDDVIDEQNQIYPITKVEKTNRFMCLLLDGI